MAFLEHILNSDSGQSRVPISWTILVCQRWSQDIAFADTRKTDIPAYLLTRRTFGQCILAGTLLETIFQHGETDDRLKSVCEGQKGDVFVSTTRCPVFGGQLRAPGNGYRLLGPCPELRSVTGMPNPVCASSQDIVECNSEHVSVGSFFGGGYGETLGITPQNHFFLIFEISNLPGSRAPIPRLLPRPLQCPSPIESPNLLATSGLPSPSQWALPSPRNISDRQPPLTLTSSSSSNSGDERGIVCRPGTNQGRQPTTPTASSREQELTEGLDIGRVCQIMGISSTTFRGAIYEPGARNTALYRALINFKHLLDILECLRLDEPKSRQDYAGGLQLDMADVIELFNWNMFSYQKKYLAYRWGQKVADASWKGDIPAKGKSLYTQYQRWRGIVWFFQPGGGLDRQVSPQKIQNKPDEVAAAGLNQTMLFEKRSLLEGLLQFC
ncbi:hypothetical protein BDN72DRAFT_851242 [Pluteus cervinus]|uniref:Uncharacterized protein n=1 Tax=Pluteus cervinus TaxID=181527 RepID=A0ACD3A2B8_9AGAR|nr:hypothetical protein BDN72DRAFT_851242 [Pluteus cervinus]